MANIDEPARDIATMPRGGPDASWLDRRLQTNRLEYLDRDDVDKLKRRVIRSLDRVERLFALHTTGARMALDEVADISSPKVLELGSGHGGLSRKLLEIHPTAQVTVTDIDPTFVAAIAASDLGSHPRATVREMDAAAIDAQDGEYDLAVFALSLHHLPPALASRVFAEGTRAADKLLIIDAHRPSAPVHLMMLALTLPFAALLPLIHDEVISALRAYSLSALRALAHDADPAINVEFRRARGAMVVVASRARQPGNRHRDHEPRSR
ncbi:methyltransferase type 11 [Mycobacterium sp. IS-2888]|uniref:class I SAM-dependent methyltransferase n=1 Tax=Mycobacterium sp. IS-2888 TaxID=1834159 RepID=UPI00096CB83C|nr:class I SAM-dependent methyltransferase [Mycobacterium sp. IS-2888]OMC54004.1 methyltransferase type 11 [Mycobacterium sp. IS-2888]